MEHREFSAYNSTVRNTHQGGDPSTNNNNDFIIHRIKLGLMCILFIELCERRMSSEYAFWTMEIKFKMALRKIWAGKLQLHFIPRNYAPIG